MNPYVRSLLEGIYRKPVLIRPSYLSTAQVQRDGSNFFVYGIFADLQALAKADVVDINELAQIRRDELCKAYGFAGSDPAKPFAFAAGNAIIPIHGSLMNRFPYSMGFATGYNFINAQREAAVADPDVSRIIYDVNSNGGMVSGCPECAAGIFQSNAANGGKQSVALVDSNCYSAAYYLASAADHIAVTPSGGAGSVGVVMAHMDVSKLLDDVGVKVTLIHAGDHKVDGNMFEPLSEEVTSDFQAEVDKIYGRFVSDIASFRPGLTEEAVRETQARVYQADDALALGLVDSVQSPPDALRYLDAKQTDGVITMATTTQQNAPALTQADVDTASNAARVEERARVSAIIGHAEAEGRTQLAQHLAMNTALTVEAAGEILKNSPKAAAAAPAPAPAPEPKQTNHFQNAMDKGKHPNAGSGQDGGGEQMTRAQRILAAQAKATGRAIEGKPAS